MTFWALINGASGVHTIGDPALIGSIDRSYDAAVGQLPVVPNSLWSRNWFLFLSAHVLDSATVFVMRK